MVFLRKSLLPPEPGLVRRSRRMAQRHTIPGEPEPGVEGGHALLTISNAPSMPATVHVGPGGITDPSLLPCEALDSCLRLL